MYYIISTTQPYAFQTPVLLYDFYPNSQLLLHFLQYCVILLIEYDVI